MSIRFFTKGMADVGALIGVGVSIFALGGSVVSVVSYGEGIKSDVRHEADLRIALDARIDDVEKSYTAAVGDLGKKMESLHDDVIEQSVQIGTIKGTLRLTSRNFGASPAAVDMIEREVRSELSTSTP